MTSTFVRTLVSAAVVASSMFVGMASAAPILQIENAILTGVKNIVIDGKLYDVEFVGGSCSQAFAPCDASSFLFTTRAGAGAAAQALADQVFLNDSESNSDGLPANTRGCDVTLDCWFFNPYAVDGDRVEAVGFHNAVYMPDAIEWLSTDVTARYTNVTYARWTAASAAVPEPGSIALMGLAMAGFAFSRRRKS